jgi:hypothetical protein
LNVFDHLHLGFNISSVDEAFRKKYFPLIYESSGEENLILAKVNDEVGYGVYAGNLSLHIKLVSVDTYFRKRFSRRRVYCQIWRHSVFFK